MTSSQPREFITYLGYMISYLVAAISFIIFSFSLLNIIYPEMGSYAALGYSTVLGSLGVFTTAIIVFFILVYAVIRIVHDGKTSPESKPRLWILHIGKFIGFAVTAVTMAILIRYFFSGEITIRFMIKTAVVLVVAANAVLFFRHESRRTTQTPSWISWTACAVAGAVLIASIIGTFMYVGTPNIARSIRNDEQRIADLQNIQSQVINWYQSHGTLPENLAVLKQIPYYTEPRDPNYVRGATYAYTLIDAKKLHYNLCADFDLGSDNTFVVRKDRASQDTSRGMAIPVAYDSTGAPAKPITSETSLDNPWDYTAGHYCFDRSVDTKMYPVFKNEPVRID